MGTPTETIVYGYGDAAWKDELTSYKGQQLSYDTIGNPLTYRDGMRFTWENGRQMKTFSQGDTSAIYIYNGEGQRIAKSVNGNRTDYVLDAGGTILAERKKGVAIRYLFDEAGTRSGFVWGSEKDLETLRTYYYVFNGQGDVIALQDSNGIVQARYTYDMWGKLLSVTDASGTAIPESNWTHAGHLNSFRYQSPTRYVACKR